MLNRLLIAASVAVVVAALVLAVWNLCGWPPPRLILKYGFPPTGGPTGRTMTIEGVEFVELKPGYFRMGSHFLCEEGDLLGRLCAALRLPWGKQPRHDGNSGECPPHWVEIEQGYWISRTEVTNRQYEAQFPDHGRSYWGLGDEQPVLDVSALDAVRLCDSIRWKTHRGVRLPTECEWEYAAQAGKLYYPRTRSALARTPREAWSAGNSDGQSRDVDTMGRNHWGLADIVGNALEWCTCSRDCETEPLRNRSTPSQAEAAAAVLRGGSYRTPAGTCVLWYRVRVSPEFCDRTTGIRLVSDSETDRGHGD